MDEEKLLTRLAAATNAVADADRPRTPSTASSLSDHDDAVSHMHDANAPVSAPAASAQHRTGPKGVISDYRHNQRVMRERERERERLRQDAQWRPAPAAPTATRASDDDDDLLLLLDTPQDHQALLRYREQRLQQLRTASQRKRFGRLVDITHDDYVGAIDHEHPSVPVIVLIHEPAHPECRMMGLALEQLAQRFVLAKFLRIQAREAQFNVAMDVLPALLVYRAGLLIGNWMQATIEAENYASRELGTFDVDVLREFLVGEGMLDETDERVDGHA